VHNQADSLNGLSKETATAIARRQWLLRVTMNEYERSLDRKVGTQEIFASRDIAHFFLQTDKSVSLFIGDVFQGLFFVIREMACMQYTSLMEPFKIRFRS